MDNDLYGLVADYTRFIDANGKLEGIKERWVSNCLCVRARCKENWKSGKEKLRISYGEKYKFKKLKTEKFEFILI